MRPALLLLALAPGCTRPLDEPITPPNDSKEAQPPAASAGASTATELDPRFVPLIAAAFRDYKTWARVDDELRWAPWLCRMPQPGRARMSAAEDGGHARKLYSVFAKDQHPYPVLRVAAPVPQPLGQILVKESYYPELMDKPIPQDELTALQEKPTTADHFNPYVRVGDQVYRASRLAGAYVVLKVAPETPGTDAGWVYGTVTPEGEVTSAGRVASCMGCHVSARHERVFGLEPANNGDN